MQDSALIRVFRVTAVLEALSWVALIVAMVCKYGPSDAAGGVHVMGPVHGVLFLVYAVVTAVTSRRLRWSARVTLVGLLSSIPPCCSYLFERWVLRHDTAGASGF